MKTNNLIFIIALIILSAGIASAQNQSGTLTIDSASGNSYAPMAAASDSTPVLNFSHINFYTIGYNYIQKIDLYSTGAISSYDTASSTFTIRTNAGNSGSGIWTWTKSTSKIIYTFNTNSYIVSTPIVLDFDQPTEVAKVHVGGDQVTGEAPTLTRPVVFNPGNYRMYGGGTSVLIVQSSKTVSNNYTVNYSIIGNQTFFSLFMNKGGATVNTKAFANRSTGNNGYFNESTFNTVSFNGSAQMDLGLRLYLYDAVGNYDTILLNSTGSPAPEDTHATITTDKTEYHQTEIMNYTVSFINPVPGLLYNVKMYKDVNTPVASILLSDYTGINGTHQRDIGFLANGTYHLEVQELETSIVRGLSSDFTVIAGTIPTGADNISTTKPIYALGETQYITGYATTVSQISIYSGATLMNNMGSYTGTFQIARTYPTGQYLVVMTRNVGGHVSAITSVSYTVSNNATAPISINMVDPGTFDCGYCYDHNTADRKFAIGNTDGGSDGGQMITVQYNRKNDNDNVTIYAPDGSIFTSWNVSTYTTWLTSREFYVPNEQSSIGIWTATIVDSTNASNFSTSTLKAFIYNNYIDNGETNGNAIIKVSDTNPCSNTIVGISWNTTNLQAGYWVKLYKVSPFLFYVNETYTSPTGTISFYPTISSTEYRFTITNITGYQTINSVTIITKAPDQCAAVGGVPGTTPATPTSAQMNLTATNMLLLFTQIALYGLVIFIGVIFALVKLGVQGSPLVVLGALIATFESLVGLFGGYGIYIIVLSWILCGVYFKFGRDMTTGGQ